MLNNNYKNIQSSTWHCTLLAFVYNLYTYLFTYICIRVLCTLRAIALLETELGWTSTSNSCYTTSRDWSTGCWGLIWTRLGKKLELRTRLRPRRPLHLAQKIQGWIHRNNLVKVANGRSVSLDSFNRQQFCLLPNGQRTTWKPGLKKSLYNLKFKIPIFKIWKQRESTTIKIERKVCF